MRLLHTSDWQLGMTRHFLAGEAQARFDADRIEAVRALLRLAYEAGCEAVLVAGDVFESNQVGRQTIVRALDCLGSSEVPIYLLPGNHDPLDATSVYRSRTFLDNRPAQVHVLDSPEPRILESGAEIVGAPWPSARPLQDLVAATLASLSPAGLPRVVVGHGAVDRFMAMDREDPALIELACVEEALKQGKLHFLALGDRHSTTAVGSSGRVWYSGTQEATDFGEQEPGQVLLVDVDAASCRVEPRRVGKWTFFRELFELATEADIERVGQGLRAFPDKSRTVAKLAFKGTLSLKQHGSLESVMTDLRELLAAVIDWQRMGDLVVLPAEDDLADLELTGYARTSADRLKQLLAGGNADALAALSLLLRLSRRAS